MWKLIAPEINKHSRVSGTNQQAEQIYLFGLLTTGFFQSAIPPDTSIRCPFTHLFSSERSAAIIGSSGTPARPRAVISATRLLSSGLSRTRPPPHSVANHPYTRPVSEGGALPV